MSDCFSVLGVKIKIATMHSAVSDICKNIAENKQTMVVTANPEIVMMCKKDNYYNEIVNTAEFVFADGIGVVWAGKRLGHDIKERVTGFDLANELFKLADTRGYKVFLFGAAEGVAQKAMSAVGKKYPGIDFVGCRNGFFTPADEPGIIEQINLAEPDILLVAFGAPKQEKWLYENKQKLNCKVLLGIGGTFDVLAGKSKRAPLLLQKLGMEWFYRLCKEPKRFARMLVLPEFVLSVLFSKNN